MIFIVQYKFLVGLLLACIIGSITKLRAFTFTTAPVHRRNSCCHQSSPDLNGKKSLVPLHLLQSETSGSATENGEDSVRVRDLLSDLPTPTLLIELSLAEKAFNNTSMSLDDFLQNRLTESSVNDDNTLSSDTNTMAALDGSIFIHTRVTDTSVRDRVNRELGSGKSPVIGRVDACPQQHSPGGAFLGIGLSNHHVGGYYWARGMGIGASLEAHGVAFREVEAEQLVSSSSAAHTQNTGGELYWTKRGLDPTRGASSAVSRGATTEESSNSNDGKRSEWADFLVHGDTVQLIPYNSTRVLRESVFDRLVGVRRVGRPLGADPIVERLWQRGLSAEDSVGRTASWIPL